MNFTGINLVISQGFLNLSCKIIAIGCMTQIIH